MMLVGRVIKSHLSNQIRSHVTLLTAARSILNIKMSMRVTDMLIKSCCIFFTSMFFPQNHAHIKLGSYILFDEQSDY